MTPFPTCPVCKKPDVMPIREIAWWRAQNPGCRLWCASCGHAYAGTDAEVAQADAAIKDDQTHESPAE